jgi:hypothetical protein
MAHDASKVLLGTITSSIRDVTNESGDPTTFVAGLAVRRADDGALQLEDDSTAVLIGVSVGSSLSGDVGKTAVCRAGEGVPIRVKQYAASGTVEITDYAALVDGTDDTITVGEVVFTAQAGAATEGDDTFQAATSDAATAASLAAQINAHEDLMDLVIAEVDGAEVTITALDPGTDGNSIALEYSDEGTDTEGATVSGSGTLEGGVASPAILGKKVYVNDAGEACDDGDADAAATGAVYSSVELAGVDAVTKAEVPCALISMPGGL